MAAPVTGQHYPQAASETLRRVVSQLLSMEGKQSRPTRLSQATAKAHRDWEPCLDPHDPNELFAHHPHGWLEG